MQGAIQDHHLQDISYSRLYTFRCLWVNESSLKGQISVFVSFIDDYSKKVWLYFMKNKYETFTKFKL